ncbi:MAG: zinc ribbon domain-containing protein [Thermodesulfovibrionales bacterium]|nr:zinc ribbon domain-containing protein [Thermodesulfovibrionales bacterium]
MPIYEYICHKCSEAFTALRPVHMRAEDAQCPMCGSEDVRKKLSSFSSLSSGSVGSSGYFSGGGGG